MMTPPVPDDASFEDEEGARTEVDIAIDLALRDVLDDGERREPADYDREKLAHFAIRDDEVSLTHSWYLAGVHTPAPVDRDAHPAWKPGSQYGELRAQETAAGSRIADLREYFRTEEFLPGYTLRRVVYTDEFEFLGDYYRSEAPEKYRDLYVHSIDLRERLFELTDEADAESEHATLGEFGGGRTGGVLDSAAEAEVRHLVSDLHLDLAAIETLNGTKKAVSGATDLVERVLAGLTELDTVTLEQRRALDGLHDFFYYHVWKYPALGISAETAEGSNAYALKLQRLQEFDGFDEKLAAETDRMARRCRDAGLLPGLDDRVAGDSGAVSYLNSLLRDAVDDR